MRFHLQYKLEWTLSIEEIQFWIVPGRPRYWEMGGSQFTKTLCTGYAQTTKNDKGYGTHSRFPGFVHIPCTGSWWTEITPPLQGGGWRRLGPAMTERRNGFAVFSCSIRIHTLGLWVGTFKYLFIAGQPERWVIDRHKENILIAFFSLFVAL